ncbi:hypothetical protein DFH11DRAFT_1751612 [Phellopilus nigrolimitatus]|nr:hypothetical protein DFH11DRAFT_1751612 [Phellopilus nigrolimitatus]
MQSSDTDTRIALNTGSAHARHTHDRPTDVKKRKSQPRGARGKRVFGGSSLYDIREWLCGAYPALGKRIDPLSVEESARLGYDFAIKMGHAHFMLGDADLDQNDGIPLPADHALGHDLRQSLTASILYFIYVVLNVFRRFTCVLFLSYNLSGSHEMRLRSNRGSFRGMFAVPTVGQEGDSDNNPIHLEGIKEAAFRTFLEYFTTVDQWSAVLDLAHMWEFEKIRGLAITRLQSINIDEISKVEIAQKYIIEGVRAQPLTVEEAAQIGFDVAVKLAQVREWNMQRKLSSKTQSAYVDRTWASPSPTLEDQLREDIRRVFELSLVARNLDYEEEAESRIQSTVVERIRHRRGLDILLKSPLVVSTRSHIYRERRFWTAESTATANKTQYYD